MNKPKQEIIINATTKEVLQILKRLEEKYGKNTKLKDVIKAEYNRDEVTLY